MTSVLLTLVLAASTSFPLPTVDGKALAVTEKQKSFRLPIRFEKVRDFYQQQFKDNADVKLRLEGVSGQRILTFTNGAKTGQVWRSAKVSEKETETVIDVTPVIRLEGDTVEGNAKPLVEFVFGRSPEVEKSLKSIDHTEDMRAR